MVLLTEVGSPQAIIAPLADPITDISASNVAFTCKNILYYCENENEIIEDLGGEPEVIEYCGPEPRPKNLPAQLIHEAYWTNWIELPEESIRLIDFGESFPSNNTVSPLRLAQPLPIRAPETHFLESIDYRHDLWRAGCVVRSSRPNCVSIFR